MNETAHPYPRILVITSCTGEKREKPTNQLIQSDFYETEQLKSREEELADFATPASQLYTGYQHLQVMKGVNHLRDALGSEVIDLMILSAGYGLIPEDQIIVPYEVSFNTMTGQEIDEWSRFLDIHRSLEQAIHNYDLIFILLGENYIRSLSLPIEVKAKQTFIFLTSQGGLRYINRLNCHKFSLPLNNSQAKKYGYGLIGLKGFLFNKFSQSIQTKPETIHQVKKQPCIFQELIDSEIIQLELPLSINQHNQQPLPSKSNEMETLEEETFKVPQALNSQIKMQYLIPEWDDHVDPGYDFINDLHPPNRRIYDDDVYAHELFKQSNYDGILVSKVVVEKSKTKKQKIDRQGIHRFIRYSGQVMGDCGAFSYLKDEEPPYTSEEILNYYEHLGFNYGVSIDHLIFGKYAERGIREKRYQITIDKAKEFIERYRAGNYSFIPIGAVQGWDPESYAKAAKEYIDMGYDYLALGGLAYAKTKDIVAILKAIHPYIKPTTHLHLFGVGRIDAIHLFRHLGVTSFDSASPLRKAWLDPATNYYTLSGKTYTAIRIPMVFPESLKSNRGRVKKAVEAQVADVGTLKSLEQKALTAMRKYHADQISLDETLDAVLDFEKILQLADSGSQQQKDKLLQKTSQSYRNVLEERPWQNCNCSICQQIGVEVIIFRGNDRNRRRGFHNTYIFYQRFKDIIKNKI